MSQTNRRHVKTRPGGTRVTLGAASHVGLRRSTNQDAYCVLAGEELPPGIDGLAAVADGMGGHRGGEVASSLAIHELLDRVTRHEPTGTARAHSFALGPHVEAVNGEVYQAAMTPDLRGMGTTLTAAALIGGALELAHVGDSRAYLLRDRAIRRLTRDHSWVEEQVAAGLLTRTEAEGHPGRNMLTRALGISQRVEVDGVTLEVQPHDILLLCSDGLHSLVGDDEIARVLTLQEPQRACETLIERANARGGSDNITAVVLRVDKLPKPGQSPGDAAVVDGAGHTGAGKGLLSRVIGRKRS